MPLNTQMHIWVDQNGAQKFLYEMQIYRRSERDWLAIAVNYIQAALFPIDIY